MLGSVSTGLDAWGSGGMAELEGGGGVVGGLGHAAARAAPAPQATSASTTSSPATCPSVSPQLLVSGVGGEVGADPVVVCDLLA